MGDEERHKLLYKHKGDCVDNTRRRHTEAVQIRKQKIHNALERRRNINIEVEGSCLLSDVDRKILSGDRRSDAFIDALRRLHDSLIEEPSSSTDNLLKCCILTELADVLVGGVEDPKILTVKIFGLLGRPENRDNLTVNGAINSIFNYLITDPNNPRYVLQCLASLSTLVESNVALRNVLYENGYIPVILLLWNKYSMDVDIVLQLLWIVSYSVRSFDQCTPDDVGAASSLLPMIQHSIVSHNVDVRNGGIKALFFYSQSAKLLEPPNRIKPEFQCHLPAYFDGISEDCLPYLVGIIANLNEAGLLFDDILTPDFLKVLVNLIGNKIVSRDVGYILSDVCIISYDLCQEVLSAGFLDEMVRCFDMLDFSARKELCEVVSSIQSYKLAILNDQIIEAKVIPLLIDMLTVNDHALVIQILRDILSLFFTGFRGPRGERLLLPMKELLEEYGIVVKLEYLLHSNSEEVAKAAENLLYYFPDSQRDVAIEDDEAVPNTIDDVIDEILRNN